MNERIPGRNAKEIYKLIRTQGVALKADLLEKSKLTVSTLTRILEELISLGLILEAGFGESTGGRKPILYKINPAYAHVFGLDISRTYSKLILFDLDLKIVDTVRWSMTTSMTPEKLINEIIYAVQTMMTNHNIALASCLGMGIGAVGPLDRTQGIIRSPKYFPANGWSNVPICQMIEEPFGFPVMLDNGTNTSILGEYWASSQYRYQHLLYVTAGVGIRSSMMTSGKVVYGAVDMEGSIGQMIIQTDGPPPREPGGNYGSLESYVSIYALEQKAQSLLKSGRKCMLNELVYAPEDVRFHHLLYALNEKDPLAVEIFTQSATCFGIGLANVLNILHPEHVILGGPLIDTNDLFFAIAKEVALEKTYDSPSYSVEFSRGKLGSDGIATGAAVMMINQLTE
ncbi:ROK family protein [Fodinisporobacter ferrooxydans]